MKNVEMTRPAPVDSRPLSAGPSEHVPGEVPIHHCRADSPLRPLDWRWRRANYLVGAGKRGRRREDPLVVRVVRWLRSRVRRPKGYRTDWPEMTAAREIYDGVGVDGGRRVEIEGYLLAGESDDQIGKRFGLNPGVARTFGDVYFAVRERVDDPATLYFAILGPEETLREDEREKWIRVLGWIGGPHVLDAYVQYANQPPPVVPKRFDRLSFAELKALQGRLLFRRLLLTWAPDVPVKDRVRWHIATELGECRRYSGW